MIGWFEKVVGRENVGSSTADKEIYGTDASSISGLAKLVVWPTDAKQIHQIIIYAKKGNINLVCRGGGSSITGAVNCNGGVVLDFSKMNKILKFSEEFVTVEPGVNIKYLNRFLASKGKIFPVVPSSSKISTIGGMVGCNASGQKDRMKYGRMFDWVSEAEGFDGTGRRRTFKAEEICGSEGQVGIITNVKLRITEPIKERSLTIFKLKDIEKLVEKVVELRWNKKVLNLEFIDSVCAVNAGLDNINYLIVEYDGLDGEILDGREITRVWNKRKNAVMSLFSSGYLVEEDPVIPLENMVEFLYWLKRKNIPGYGHIGLGIIHANFKTREMIKEFYDFVLTMKGEISGEYGYGILRKEYIPEDIKTNIFALKRKYDPENLFNKGKINYIKIEDELKKNYKAKEWKGFKGDLK